MQTTTLTAKDGESFELTCNMLEPDAAYKLVTKLGKVLMPLVVARAAQKTADAGPVMDQMFGGLTPELAEQVRLELLSTMTVARTSAEGQLVGKYDLCNGRMAINNAFRNHTLMMFRAMKFAAEVNFRDFFDESGLASFIAQTPSA